MPEAFGEKYNARALGGEEKQTAFLRRHRECVTRRATALGTDGHLGEQVEALAEVAGLA